MKNHYYKTKLVKMGVWDLLPADTGCWMTGDGNKYFKKVFGIPKGILIVCTLEDEQEHPYTPANYIKQLYKRIDEINIKDYKGLEKILLGFYKFKRKALQEIPQINPRNLKKISNKELTKIYWLNRDWCHQATVYDQFGWIGEDYWQDKMESILIKKGIKKNSGEYYQALFALTKPEEISTTLSEKRDILIEVIKIKEKKTNIQTVAKKIAKKYGFMPIFAYGDPWDEKHYQTEIKEYLKYDIVKLKKNYLELKNYSKNRNDKFNQVINEFNLNKKEKQIFIDFGLMLDARNEAEYLVSLAGFYLLPIYKEMARRLSISIKQLRTLYEDEIIEVVLGKKDIYRLLKKKGKYVAYGFDEKMNKELRFDAQESEKLFKHIEKNIKPIQGTNTGKGLCANVGKVRGRAKILNSTKEMDKVKKGDIMISVTTSVDSLPAMKRAKAFVTEIGGLTCHAAVVSREFGVPCITSYKNATKVFKDGDLIEVDAERGIVRKV